MPWYRIYANHGAGHQSHTEFYRWYNEPLNTKQKREDAWMEVFDDGRREWPIGDVELVEKLPQTVHNEKVAAFQKTMFVAQDMLEILTKTETMPEIVVRFEIIAATKPGEKPTTGFQARTPYPSNIAGAIRPTKKGAIISLLKHLHITNNGKSRRARKSDYVVTMR